MSRVNVPERVLQEEAEAIAARDQILRRDGQPAPTAPQESTQEPAPTAQPQAPVNAEPAPEGKPQPAPSEQVQPPATDTAAALKQQMEAMKADFSRKFGQIGAEVQKWRDRVGQLMDENADLATKLAGKAPEEAKAAQAAVTTGDHTRYLTDEEKGEIGADLAGIVAKIARAAAEDALKPFAGLPEQVQQVHAHAAAVTFVEAVDRLAPGFSDANGNPDLDIPAKDADWLAYLQSPDPLRGVPMGQIIGELEGQQRVMAAANAFKMYSQIRANAEPAAAQRPALADQATPPRRTAGSSHPTPNQRGPKRYTMAEFDASMAEARKLGLTTKEGERLYRELAQASKEGRVLMA